MRILQVVAGPRSRPEQDVDLRRWRPLYGELRALDCDLHIAMLGDPLGTASSLRGVVPVHVVRRGVPPRWSGALGVVALVPELRRIVRDVRPDVVEGAEPLPTIAAALALRAAGPRCPLLYRRHHQRGSAGLRVASALAAHLADRTVVSSEVMRLLASRQDCVSPEHILVSRSGAADFRGVDPGLTAALRGRLGLDLASRVVVTVCMLRPDKGLDVLIRAMAGMAPRAVLVVVGDGPERGRLEELAMTTRAPVRFVGHQTDVAHWYALADVVCIPSRQEAFGRTTVEAMAAGRPVVASAVGGLVEAVTDGITGMTVPAEDVTALRRAVERLVADGGLRASLGAAARTRFEERHSISAMAHAWLAIWESAVTRPAAAQR